MRLNAMKIFSNLMFSQHQQRRMIFSHMNALSLISTVFERSVHIRTPQGKDIIGKINYNDEREEKKIFKKTGKNSFGQVLEFFLSVKCFIIFFLDFKECGSDK